jgi:hypothetical protein
MPSESQPGSTVDREEFSRLRSDIGEDPARFLDHELVTDQNLRELALARIRGIDEIATCRAWIAVERRLDRGPREAIIERLQERIETLEEIGERPDRLTIREKPRDIPEKRVIVDGEPAGDRSRTAAEKIARIRADGGEDE